MAKEESENDLSSNSNDLQEPLKLLNDVVEKKDQHFRVPIINYKYKTVQKKLKRYKRNKLCPEMKGNSNEKSKKFKKHSKKKFDIEIASDKNIATLLRSERLIDFIKKGFKIPDEIARNISQKTGFKSVNDLNNHISAHRKKFIVLVDRKENQNQNESSNCNNTFRRADSVDLNLYFTHHFRVSLEKSDI